MTKRNGVASSAFRIPYGEALKTILLSEIAAPTLPKELRSETAAIVTHWLQSPDQVPFLGHEQKEGWLKQLSTHCSFKNMSVADIATGSIRTRANKGLVKISAPDVPFSPPARPCFTFIDLFAGIGGFRIGLQEQGGKCVFSSEWDQHSKRVYFENFGEFPFGDIRQFTGDAVSDEFIRKQIPDHDVLAAGFPCQPFSVAGVSARNSLGKSHGFSCEIQGTLFFDIVRIVKAKKPKVLFLENVKNLQSHDEGRTFQKIRETIEDDLKYSFTPMVIDASPLVPQKRKRCYMVCLRNRRKFEMPEIKGPSLPLSKILEKDVPPEFTISDKMWIGHRNRTERNLNRGTGFTAFAADISKPANTLVARYYKDGKECLVPQKGKNPRMLTPRECARLQGYPEGFIVAAVRSQAYRQFGNSVAVPVIEVIAEAIVQELHKG
jgi:DNA (cytosine-5)-methyltransferase 1